MLGKTIRVPRHVELSEPGWRRTKPPLVELYSPKLEQRSLEVRNRAVLGFGSALLSRSLTASYFGHHGKCNFFLSGSILARFFCRRGRDRMQEFALFPRRRPVCSLLLRQQHHSQHLIPRRGLARPDLKLPRCLVNEHLNARNDLCAPFLG